MRLAPRLRSIVLTAGAVLGGLCLLAALASVFLGVKPLVFTSGSMSPTIPAGAVAFAKSVPAADLKSGDIVSVFTKGGARVTHRVVSVSTSGTDRILMLKGDANKTADAETYPVSSADRVMWSVPYVGYAISFLGTPVGLFLLGACAVGVLVLGFWPGRSNDNPTGAGPTTDGRRRAPADDGRRITPGGKRRATMMAVSVAAALMVCTATPTAAAFFDDSAVASGALTAYTVPKPVLTCKTTSDGGLLGTGIGATYTATISWPVVSSPPLTYSVVIAGVSSPPAIATSNGTDSVAVTSGLLSSLTGKTTTVGITATLPNSNPGWTATANQILNTGLLGLSFGCA